MALSKDRIRHNFQYHMPATEDEIIIYQEIRSTARKFGLFLWDRCPDSRERSMAITKLEEVVMWANASIARNEIDDR